MKADEIYAVELTELLVADEDDEDGGKHLAVHLTGRIGPFDHLTKARTAVREHMARRTAPEEVIRFAIVQVRDVMEFEPRVVYRERENGKASIIAVDAGDGILEPIDAGESVIAQTGGWATTLLPLDVEEAAGDAS